ncbi:UTP--glucose-1-phosphate uridylyltransferase GalU [Arthrobacter sp. MYb213]|uniref:UTP--glucose-1-phosphate uridylyltransferase GalU n=1 Tax=Arthrobacter sp. MYb213 TaxID=1848595 RepID=UPI000CFC6A18|nr:UTP--glucose-1-phosphate uridylyltransferase GalU [Arthrobacter sp. MYb213]PRB72705.1 UTP--glucose-1-phosphate uridylyltransferase [Arthrobacter sp. MYb213]
MALNPKITKAVIPAAGLGTRFLPATKAMPKEMLPVVDKPAIQYVVAEAVKAGLNDVLMITGRSKRALEDHFDRVPSLEASLEAKGDTKKLRSVQEATELGDIHYVRQRDPRGLGHAVLCAKQHVGNEPFAVLLGDDLIDSRDELLSLMVETQQKTGGSVIALMEVEPEQISAYGCADVSSVEGEDYVKVNALVEKPSVEEAPSNLAIIGRYLLHPQVFEVLEHTAPGRGGEIQLTDALQELATGNNNEGGGVHAVIFRGRRYDTGDKLSYLQANVTLAVENEELGEGMKSWLKTFVATLDN